MPEAIPEKGLLSFIKTKMEHAVLPAEIKRMLVRAGFSESHIERAFGFVRKNYKDTHQDLAAANEFLPPLSKAPKDRNGNSLGAVVHHPLNTFGRPSHVVYQHAGLLFETYKGLFMGRLRRKDFVLGFLFFFGIGYIALAYGSLFISLAFPHTWQFVNDIILADSNNYLLMLTPVVLAPITIMSLSLIARRLHNLGLPGGLGFLFLILFVPSFDNIFQVGFVALEIALLILFIVLITVKGNPASNKYGALPGSKGSFFKRIFNI